MSKIDGNKRHFANVINSEQKMSLNVCDILHANYLDEKKWCLDSSETSHMFKNLHDFQDIEMDTEG